MRDTFAVVQAVRLQEDTSHGGGLIVPLGVIIAVVMALSGAVAVLFKLYRKAYSDLLIEKERRLMDVQEYERALAALKEKLASRKGGGPTSA